MNNLPLVTIGVPNYNYAQYIIETLDSVVKQTYQNIELIIVDDVSTDNSIEIIEDWIKKYDGPIKINFIKNRTNGGLTKVCNQILKNARGKYFQTLDADDIIFPDKIEKQVAILEASPNTSLVYSNIGVMDESGNVIDNNYLGRIHYDKDNMPEGNVFERLFNFNFIPLPSVLINTSNARCVGGFDETLQVQDYYLWLKLSEKFLVKYLPENTALYRQHSVSMSNNSLTNPKSADSVLEIKYRYYKKANNKIKSIIRKNIYYSSAYLYRSSYSSAGKWLKRNLILNPGLVSAVYFTASSFGISCSFLDKLKSSLSTSKFQINSRDRFKKLAIYTKSIPYYYYYKFFFNKSASDKIIFIDIRKNHFKRYLYLLIKFFNLEGYTVFVNRNFELIYELKNELYVSFLFKERIINVGKPTKKIGFLTIDDKFLSPDYFSKQKNAKLYDNPFYVPMTQHPLMYHEGFWNKPLEQVKRKKSLFMVGNFDENAYSLIERDKLFNVMSRSEVYSYLKTKSLFQIIETEDDLNFFLESNIDNKVILIDRKSVEIPMDRLRNVLNQFDFYFALPGVVMPFSHNIIEAISAGCIPFLQNEYANLFNPRLRNGENVVTFDDVNNLEKQINYLFTLNKDDIGLLRANVYNYYNNFLTPDKVIESIEKSNFDKIYLQAEHYSVDILKNPGN